VAPSVATLIRRASGVREQRTAGGAGLDTSTDKSSQRWVYGIAAGRPHGRLDVWGSHSLEKKAAAKGCEKRSAGSRLRICPAISSRCGGRPRVYLDHRGCATGSKRTGDARYLPGILETHRRAQKSRAFASDFDVFADQVAHRRPPRMRSTPHSRRGAQTIRAIEVVTSRYPCRQVLMCGAPSPANRRPCQPGLPAPKSSNAARISSPASAASPPLFTG